MLSNVHLWLLIFDFIALQFKEMCIEFKSVQLEPLHLARPFIPVISNFLNMMSMDISEDLFSDIEQFVKR